MVGHACTLSRADLAILVPGANTMGGIGAIRSLGAAGYRVHAAAESVDALGLRSKFATERVVHPATEAPEFADWFETYLGTNDIRMIVPGAGFGLGLHDVFERHAALFPDRNSPEVMARRAKYDLFECLLAGDERHRAHLPPLALVDLSAELPDAATLARLGTPLFMKFDGSHALPGGGGEPSVRRFLDAGEAARHLSRLRGRYAKVVIQGFVPGMGSGAFLLRWNGRVHGRFMHLRLHEIPHTGGVSSLRKSWWHETMMQDAEAKLEQIDWQGVGMVEYRWDPQTDSFHLMEMNLRFWGSLHLALFAGGDFPRLLADAFFGELPDTAVIARSDVLCRHTFPQEVSYLLSLWRDREVPLARKLHALVEALTLSLDPRVKSDLFFPGDRALYFIRLKEFIMQSLRGV